MAQIWTKQRGLWIQPGAFLADERRYKQEILAEFLPEEDMATSKSKRKRREMEEKRKRRSFSELAHHVTRGKVTYSHLGTKMDNCFVDPAKATIYAHDGACGHCPLSLICLTNRSWKDMLERFTFFKCKRCAALGFVDKTGDYTAGKPLWELHVCMLMRFGKQGGHWTNTSPQRSDSLRTVEANFVTRGGWDSYEVQQRFRNWGDIPFGCITRCRDHLGYETMKKLPDHVDCRTTIQNAVGAVKSY